MLRRLDHRAAPHGHPHVTRLIEGELLAESVDLRTRFALFEEITSALFGCANDGPLLIVLDDLHEADTASLLLTQHLAPLLRGQPILLAATARDDVTPDRPEWLAVWADLLAPPARR